MADPRTPRRLPRSLRLGASVTAVVMALGVLVAGVAGAEEPVEDDPGWRPPLAGAPRFAPPREQPGPERAPRRESSEESYREDEEYLSEDDEYLSEDEADELDTDEVAEDTHDDEDSEVPEDSEDPADTGGSGVYVPKKLADEIVTGTPCSKQAIACVSLGAKKSWIFGEDAEGNTVIKHGPVSISTGGPGKETPVGDFVVEWKNKNHRSSEFFAPHGCKPGTPNCLGAPMNWAVFFAEGGIAFHEGMLNQRSSGCVRLSATEAEFYYNTLQLGDKVEVRG